MTVDLLVSDEVARVDAPVLFGGLPSAPDATGFAWPRCVTCNGPMQYQGRVPHPVDAGKRVLFFQCANDPGMCDEWDATSGGNAAMVLNLTGVEVPVEPPSDGVVSLDGQWSARTVLADGDTYEQAREASEEPRRQILGRLRGEPEWLQGDETPACTACGQSMLLAAQLEEGPDHVIAMNFGGCGNGYLFACRCPADTATFLWQC